MPYRRQQFENGEIYHVVLRAIDNNLIFKNIDDHYRGIFSIYEFNTTQSVEIRERRQARARFKKALRQTNGDPISDSIAAVDRRDKLVEVLGFCLMPNHLHLLLKQLKEEGISKFMQKFGTGLGGYLNRKYHRQGHVFQNSFVSVHIESDRQLRVVFVYVHTNPISIIVPKWKELGIKDPERAIKFLEKEYRWSSLFDYLGKKNFPSVSKRDFLSEVMGGSEGIKEAIEDWIRYKGEIKKEFVHLALE